jgi:ketosteroid isomerase-like protein
MNPLNVLLALDKEISGGDLDKAGQYMSDEFKFTGVGPKAFTKAETLGVWGVLRAAMPDFNHNLRNLRESGSIVYGTVEVTGTHKGTLAVPHGPTIPASGRRVQNPLERVAITVRDGKVTEWAVESVPGGGIGGIIGQVT